MRAVPCMDCERTTCYNAWTWKKPWSSRFFRTQGVSAPLVRALVFKTPKGIFRHFHPDPANHRKCLQFLVVATEKWPVDIVGGDAKKGQFSTSKG